MIGFRVEPLSEACLPEAAAYLDARAGAERPGGAPGATARHLHWRLFQNPAARPDIESGQLLRSADGRVAGVHFAIPQRFLAGDRSYLGLCSSAFYVDEAARMQGFLMFRRSLSASAPDFFFATTCLASSAALWERIGGRAVELSRREVLVPLQPARVAASRLSHPAGRAAAHALAALATPPLRLAHLVGSRGMRLQSTADWDHLAALSSRLRNPSVMTATRDAAFLEWRYALDPSDAERRVWLVRNQMGHEGWVAAARITRAFAPALRAWMVTDLVWPSAAGIDRLMLAVAEQLAGAGDMLAIRGSLAAKMRTPPPIAFRREFPHAPAWWMTRHALLSGVEPDFVGADGDTTM